MVGVGVAADAAAAARAQAARQVCAASAAFASCTHRRRRSSPHFVDWYLVLAVSTTTPSSLRSVRYSPRTRSELFGGVWRHARTQIGESASEDAVRRRYRQLGEHAQSRRAVGANGSLIRFANSSSCSVVLDARTHTALQLHPDKNRHPKAEVAFKIVSEVPYHTTRVPFPDDFFFPNEFFLHCVVRRSPQSS